MIKQRKGRLSTAVIIGIVSVLIIFGLIADLIGYRQFTETITNQYQDYAISIADEAAGQINIPDLETFRESGGTSPEFAAAHEHLQKLCNNMDAEFIYIIEVDRSDYGHIEFIFEVVNENSSFEEYPVGQVRETTNDEYREKYIALYEGSMDNAIVVRDKGVIETGSHITALVPLRDDNGNTAALLGVQRQMEYLGSARIRYMDAIICASVLLILCASQAAYIYMKKRLLAPVEAISAEAERFAAENTLGEHPLTEKITYHDELGTLASVIDEMEVKTLEYFTTVNTITAEKQRVDSELKLATDIQISMLPRKFPAYPDRDEFSIYATMDPAKEVGGDFYDLYMLDEKHVVVLIADVSGKGIPAALFMALCKTLIKTHTQLCASPAEALTKSNHVMCEGNDVGFFVTAWMGILDLETGILTYANAGHNMPLLRSGDGSFRYLKCRPGFVLAGMDEIKYKQGEIQMDPGDRLFLYTDGVTEATDAENRLYGDERLRNYLNANSNAEETELLHGLRHDINEFVGEADQFDDITMLVLDYKKKYEK